MRIRNSHFVVITLAVAIGALLLGACGNPYEGGSEPSGSVLRVIDRNNTATVQDIFFCEGEAVSYASTDFTIANESNPNFEDSTTTPDGTNSHVTLSRYTIRYTVLNMSATIPSTEGSFTVGVPPDGEAVIQGFPMFTEPILEYIRINYPEVGNGEAMLVRADITYWGKDAFDVDVSVVVSTSVTVDDFNPCLPDLPPADESET